MNKIMPCPSLSLYVICQLPETFMVGYFLINSAVLSSLSVWYNFMIILIWENIKHAHALLFNPSNNQHFAESRSTKYPT